MTLIHLLLCLPPYYLQYIDDVRAELIRDDTRNGIAVRAVKTADRPVQAEKAFLHKLFKSVCNGKLAVYDNPVPAPYAEPKCMFYDWVFQLYRNHSLKFLVILHYH